MPAVSGLDRASAQLPARSIKPRCSSLLSAHIQCRLKESSPMAGNCPWTPPAEPSEEDLLKADAEARRLACEWSSLAERQHESQDDEKALWSLLEHTNSLLDYLAAFRSKVPPRRRL